MALDVVLIGCYPVVHFIAKSRTKHHDDHGNDVLKTIVSVTSLISQSKSKHERGGIIGVWRDVPGGTIAGIVTMLVVKAFAGLTWGYVIRASRLHNSFFLFLTKSCSFIGVI